MYLKIEEKIEVEKRAIFIDDNPKPSYYVEEN